MSTSDAAAIVSASAAVLAFGWAIVSERRARASAAAADAAEATSAAALLEMRDALQQLRPTARVEWDLQYHSTAGYELTNVGNADAADLGISIGNRTGEEVPLPRTRLRHGESMVVTTVGWGATRDVTITWRDPDGTLRDLVRALPPGPPPPRLPSIW